MPYRVGHLALMASSRQRLDELMSREDHRQQSQRQLSWSANVSKRVDPDRADHQASNEIDLRGGTPG